MKTLIQFLTLNFTTLKNFAGRSARTWRPPILLLALLIQALTLANTGAAELAGTVRMTAGDGDFAAISASNKTLTVAPGTRLTGTINLHTTNLGSSGWIAPLIYTPSWGDPSTSWQTINDWISTNPSDYQTTVSVVAPTAPGVYHVIFAYFWEIGADHVASGTNWQVGADIWTDGDEIAKLSAARIAEAQANGFTVAPRLVPTGSELFNTPADAVTLIVASPQTPRATPFLQGPVVGEPAGTKYLSFGTPQVGAFAARIQSGKIISPVIIGPDGHVLLRVGGSVPGLPGSVLARLGQPSGDAVLAILNLSAANHITATNNVVLVRGLSTGSPQVAAQIGTENPALPTGVTIKSFGAIDGNGSGLFFLATLQGNNVTPVNAVALCIALDDGSVKVLARRGDVVGGKTIATLGTLVGSAGTLGEGRWRGDETTCGVRLTFNDAARTQAVYAIPGPATSAADWTLLAQTGPVSNLPAINGTSVRSLGLPGFGPGATAAVIANLAITSGGPTAANHFALLSTAAGTSAKVIARTGDPIATDANGAALTGVKIATFFDPVAGADRQTAFAVNALRAGIPMRGIMFSGNGDAPALLANIGAAAPGGGHWASLGALVFPDGVASGPVFAGTVAVRADDGITAQNNRRLWAVDSTGALQLLLRSGQPVTIGTVTKPLSSFTALTAAPGSIGAASGHDTAGRVAVLATCTDATRAILIVEIP